MKESFLEPYLRQWRIKRVLPFLQNTPDCRLLDIGCGWEARFLHETLAVISTGTGIDPKAPENPGAPKLQTVRQRLDEDIPFADSSFDVVTMLAVLEHLAKPEAIVKEVFRVLRPGGWFIGTVPSRIAKPLLEFLAFRLNIVNPEEIRDHKKYYTRGSLKRLLGSSGFENLGHSYFQMGMNNFFCAQKPFPA